jgi:hypothetical protein
MNGPSEVGGICLIAQKDLLNAETPKLSPDLGRFQMVFVVMGIPQKTL